MHFSAILKLLLAACLSLIAFSAAAISASGYSVSPIGSGNGHACVLSVGGGVLCWGSNVDGQAGTGGNPDDNDFPWSISTPSAVVGIEGAVEVDASSRASCARLADGRVMCWGANYEGELGDGTDQRRAFPAEVKGITRARQLRSGGDQSCVVRADRGVSCWGSPRTQQSSRVRKTAQSIPGLRSVRELAVGFYGACAIVPKGRIKCWGDNAADWKPSGSNRFHRRPVLVKGISGARSVALADYSACAALRSGEVKCWGAPMTVRFKDLDRSQDFSKPRTIAGVRGAKQVIAGDYHACALLRNGKVKCWGDGDDGQLGNGRYARDQKAATVRGLSRVRALTGGFTTTCAVLSGGSVKCWGSNLTADSRLESKSATPVTIIP